MSRFRRYCFIYSRNKHVLITFRLHKGTTYYHARNEEVVWSTLKLELKSSTTCKIRHKVVIAEQDVTGHSYYHFLEIGPQQLVWCIKTSFLPGTNFRSNKILNMCWLITKSYHPYHCLIENIIQFLQSILTPFSSTSSYYWEFHAPYRKIYIGLFMRYHN